MDLKELKELIKLVTEKGITEFEIEREGFRLRICRPSELQSQTAPVILHSPAAVPLPQPILQVATAQTTAPVQSETKAPEPEVELHIIKSPIVGTFYRAPSPTSDPFIKIGDNVEQETVVCIIEAMKLMNEIHAEVTGEIVKIFVENAQPVEYGQPLFGVKI
ncbi:MAG: acetyl-CoA carboxylase biotin carboxyl carrier protein [Acidobacteriota bacterium]